MNKLLAKGGTIFDYIIGSLTYLAAAILIFIMLAVVWDVIARAVASQPLKWVLEFSEYNLLYITFLGTAWLLRRDGHVSMDILLVYLKPRASALIGFVTSILIAMICFILFWYGTQVTWEQFQLCILQSNVIENPTHLEFVVIPLGFL